jgi:hypothetical protein
MMLLSIAPPGPLQLLGISSGAVPGERRAAPALLFAESDQGAGDAFKRW